MIRVRRSPLLAAVVLLSVSTGAAANDETLARAKDLYRSASYDEALVVLDQLARDASGSTRVEASEYRLFCLIALDRKTDAHVAIESMVSADPFYQLTTNQASPRVRTMFRDIRQSLLPGILHREYAVAKASFDRQDPEAAAQFERVLRLLDDPQLPPASASSDFRMVVSGFRDLSQARAQHAAAIPPPAAAPSAPEPVAAAPVAPSTTEVAPPPAAPAVTEQAAVPEALPRPAIYREGDSGVVPPVTLKQTLPPLKLPPGQRAGASQGEALLEIVIDERGDVTSARLRKMFHSSYDQQLVRAAMGWKYEPARKDGVPVRFTKNVAVRVSAGN